MKKQIYLFVILFIGTKLFLAQNSFFEKIGEWGTGCYVDVVEKDNYIYCAAGLSGVDVIDIQNKSNPTKIANWGNRSYCKKIIINGNCLYVASTSGLYIIDIKNPKNILLIGQYNREFGIDFLVVSEPYAYIAGGNGIKGFSILDISNKRKLKLVSSYSGEFLQAEGLDFKNNLVLLANKDCGFSILDISNIKTIKKIGEFIPPPNVLYASRIISKDKYLIILNLGIGIKIADITKPEHPIIIGDYYFKGASDFFLDEKYLYLSSRENGVFLINIEDPKNLKIMGNVKNQSKVISSFCKDNMLFTANGINGLSIQDISNLSNPIQVGKYDFSGEAREVYIEGNYAYLDHGKDLKIIDISNPKEPFLAGIIGNNGHYVVAGKYAYVTSESNGLQIYDVTSPSSARVVGEFKINKKVFDCKVFNDKVYLSVGNTEIQIVDVDDPLNPKMLGKYVNSGAEYYQHLSINGKLLFVDFYEGFDTLDVSNPEHPFLINRFKYLYQTNEGKYECHSKGFFTSDRFVFISDPALGLFLINIENLNSPKFVNRYEDWGDIADIFVDGDFVYLARTKNGVHVLNIANPLKISKVAVFETPVEAEKVFVKGDYIYVADGDSGKLIIAKKPKL